MEVSDKLKGIITLSVFAVIGMVVCMFITALYTRNQADWMMVLLPGFLFIKSSTMVTLATFINLYIYAMIAVLGGGIIYSKVKK